MTIALLAVALLATLPGWLLPDDSPVHAAGAAVGTLAVLGLGAWMLFDPGWAAAGDAARATHVLLAGALAVFDGGPVAAAVLHRVEIDGRVDDAGQVLRGGAWIGAMERAAIFATVVVGWPEGLAVVLALKGLGRYPELKHPGAAERFIIGSFASVLWALASAGVLVALLR